MATLKCWKDVDRLRAEHDLSKADLARLGGIPESTIYKGLKKNSTLRPSMAKTMASVFATHEAEERKAS